METQETVIDHMAPWKKLGHSAKGLRKLSYRISRQRGLESYVTKSLHAAAARIDQLEKVISELGVEIPKPESRDATSDAVKLAEALPDTDSSDLMNYIWYEFGNDGVAAVKNEMLKSK